MSDQPWTIKRLLEWTSGYFERAGSASSRLDAEVLLASSLECERIELYTRFDEVPAEDVLSRFRDRVKRRAAGEPVAYLVGEREFYSLPFRVTPAVLIPRPETEFLIVEALDHCKTVGLVAPRIIDLGTGSGCIAIVLAKYLPEAEICAVDISEEALDVGVGNARRLDVAERIRFLSGDLFGPIEASQQFDIVISNPPYVAERSDEPIEAEVAMYEPARALFAGATGMDVIERIVRDSVERLVADGLLLIEISPQLAERCEDLISEVEGLSWQGICHDLQGQARIVRAKRSAS